ncbi:hypothetical protein KKG41_00010 [Patescibacteria group bacterium]|nr:hypothetical protein [Patescibacteria group bacterium]
MNRQITYVLIVVVVAIASGLVIFMFQADVEEHASVGLSPVDCNTNDTNTNGSVEPVGTLTEINTPEDNVALDVSGSILYVKDGDIWKSDANGKNSFNIVDRDTVVDAHYSEKNVYLGYSQYIPSIETVTYEDEEETINLTSEHDARKELYIADAVGVNSRLIADSIERWGWVPNASNLIWYESAALQRVFNLGYYGENKIWIYDLETETAQLIRDENKAGDAYYAWRILVPTWSPDGNWLAYYGYRRGGDDSYLGVSLRAVNRITKEVKDLLPIPWVGGDRGGYPPVPPIHWSNDSSSVITAFTPILGVSGNDELDAEYDKLFTSGYHTVLNIPVDGSAITRLINDAPAPVLSIESRVPFALDENQSHAVFRSYAHVSSDVFVNDPWQWFGGEYGGSYAALVYYDLENGNEIVLNDDEINNEALTHWHDNRLATLTDTHYSILMVETANDQKYIRLDKYTLEDNNTPEVVFRLLKPDIVDANSEGLQNIGWQDSFGALYFTVGNNLYLSQYDKLVKLAEGVTFAGYYLDKSLIE